LALYGGISPRHEEPTRGQGVRGKLRHGQNRKWSVLTNAAA
jgi:hypothetical protein